jgi:hypothetical protein
MKTKGIEPVYEVVWPLGKAAATQAELGSRVTDFSNKTVCQLSDKLFRASDIFPIIREAFERRYPGVRFVDASHFGNTHGEAEREVLAALPDQLRAHGCDAVISGVGG